MKRKMENNLEDQLVPKKRKKQNNLDNLRVTINNHINGQNFQAKIYFLEIELDLDELDLDEVIINVTRKQQ